MRQTCGRVIYYSLAGFSICLAAISNALRLPSYSTIPIRPVGLMKLKVAVCVIAGKLLLLLLLFKTNECNFFFWLRKMVVARIGILARVLPILFLFFFSPQLCLSHTLDQLPYLPLNDSFCFAPFPFPPFATFCVCLCVSRKR